MTGGVNLKVKLIKTRPLSLAPVLPHKDLDWGGGGGYCSGSVTIIHQALTTGLLDNVVMPSVVLCDCVYTYKFTNGLK